MSESSNTKREILDITAKLLGLGLTESQNYPSDSRDQSRRTIITWENQTDISILLKNISYKEMYDALIEDKNYNLKMIDGALIQLMYTFDNEGLSSHRLAFYPSPYLEEYQNNSDIYEEDEIYADIISRQIVPFPIRFDYSRDDSIHIEVDHPKSHITLGQYKNCRIPVHAPLSPFVFVDFILRNFYSNAFHKFQLKQKKSYINFERSITSNEEAVMHFNIL